MFRGVNPAPSRVVDPDIMPSPKYPFWTAISYGVAAGATTPSRRGNGLRKPILGHDDSGAAVGVAAGAGAVMTSRFGKVELIPEKNKKKRKNKNKEKVKEAAGSEE